MAGLFQADADAASTRDFPILDQNQTRRREGFAYGRY